MNRKKLILVILYTLASNIGLANTFLFDDAWSLEQYNRLRHISEEMQATKAKYTLQSQPVRDYDVIKYDIALDWSKILLSSRSDPPESRNWYGTTKITLKSKIDGLTVVELDAIDLVIKRVFVDDMEISPTPTITAGLLQIPIPTLSTEQEAVVEVQYKYVGQENIGFNLHYKGDNNVNESIAYTINSPEYARYWFPCNDSPLDKAQLSMSVSVPTGYSVASNGHLDSMIDYSTEYGDNRKIYYWADTTPIATFLINATASIFKQYSEWFKVPDREDSVEIQYFIWEDDYDGTVYSSRRMLRYTARILEHFSDIFLPYPYCKYGSVEAYPFIYGAMENQTMTMMSKSVLYILSGAENTIAHEIGHHWFGDLVSSKSWDDIWFKEGAATWCEALWELERTGNERYYFSSMQNEAKTYMSQSTIYTKPIYGNPASIIFNMPYVYLTYSKSSWIYHMLNVLLGQDINLSILTNLLESHKFGNIDAFEFRDHYKEKMQLMDKQFDFDIDTYFNQWLFGAGHPLYDCQSIAYRDTTQKDTVLYDVHLILSQIQSAENVAEVFKTPVFVTFYNKNQVVYSERVINDKRVQEYDFTNIPEFTTCKVDTLRTLCQNLYVKTGIDAINDKGKDIEGLKLFPNPAVNVSFVYLTKPDFGEINITNMFGQEINPEIIELQDTYQININNLEQGTYFVRTQNGMAKFIVVK